ncbi:hypothetical protein BaRGS_00033003, partial [Batillaria attramentaria]
MAAAAKALEQELEIDEDSPWGHIKCPVCLDLYASDPKILPCAHLICERCLIDWVTANSLPATCPVCRYNITDETICQLPSTMSPEEIAKALPTDTTIIAMVECVQVFDGPHLCFKCGADANSFCLDCSVKYCKKCRRKHSKVTTRKASKAAARLAGGTESASAPRVPSEPKAASTADSDNEEAASPLSNVPYIPPKKHTIELLAELTPQRVAEEKREKCAHHPGLNFRDYFCNDHNTGACLLCINAKHASCKIITMDEAAENSRKVLREQADRLKKEEEFLRQEEEFVRVKEKEAAAMAETTRSEIDHAMDMIQFRLRDEQAKLKRELAEANNLPGQERLHHQAELVQAALHRYEEYNRDHVAAINERAEAMAGGRQGQPQQPAQMQSEAASMRSIVDEVTSDLERAFLGGPASSEPPQDLEQQASEAEASARGAVGGSAPSANTRK